MVAHHNMSESGRGEGKISSKTSQRRRSHVKRRESFCAAVCSPATCDILLSNVDQATQNVGYPCRLCIDLNQNKDGEDTMSQRTSLNIGSSLRLMAVMVLWAACFPLITIGLDLVPHLAFAALRAALAGLCLIALGALCGRSIPVGGRSWVLIVVVGLGATSMGFLGMFHAAEFVSPGLATVIANVQPIIAAVLAHVFLGERLSTIGKIGLAVGLAGIAVIALPGLAANHLQGCSSGSPMWYSPRLVSPWAMSPSRASLARLIQSWQWAASCLSVRCPWLSCRC